MVTYSYSSHKNSSKNSSGSYTNYRKPVVVKQPRKKITPSVFQQTIFDSIIKMVEFLDNNLIVQAVAGSGKTTTLVESLFRLQEHFGQNISACFLAFNKKVATELESRVPNGVEARTLHSFGMKCLGRVYLNKHKVIDILKDLLQIKDGRTLTSEQERQENARKYAQAFALARFVSLCKNKAILPEEINLPLVLELADYYSLDDINIGNEEVSLIRETLEISNNNQKGIDYDDMVYLPAILGMAPIGYKVLFVDEAQDLNETQLLFLENMKRKNKNLRFVFVGDYRQAIYGFRGAGTDSMKIIKTRFGCDELPLSVCYRCGQQIVEEAKKIVPEIQAHDKAPCGVVEELQDQKAVLTLAKEEMANLAVLCRTNAPLVPLAYSFMREGLPVVIIGRDIAQNLINLIDKVMGKEKSMSVIDFAEKLSVWAEREIEKYRKANKDEKVLEIQDKEATILAFSDGCSDTNELKARINSIYKDDNEESIVKNSIKFLTIHKSKGLEFPTVGILPIGFSFSCRHEWQEEQERNLRYVARTRAINRLVYLPEKKKD